jgi:hypothetical protein
MPSVPAIMSIAPSVLLCRARCATNLRPGAATSTSAASATFSWWIRASWWIRCTPDPQINRRTRINHNNRTVPPPDLTPAESCDGCDAQDGRRDAHTLTVSHDAQPAGRPDRGTVDASPSSDTDGPPACTRATQRSTLTQPPARAIPMGRRRGDPAAPGAPVDITVQGQDAGLEVTVVNAAPRQQPSGLERSGGSFGLAGMRDHAGPGRRLRREADVRSHRGRRVAGLRAPARRGSRAGTLSADGASANSGVSVRSISPRSGTMEQGPLHV